MYTRRVMAQSPRIRIDPASGIPAVRQIVDSLRVLLVEGQLVPGATLPSVRRVAVELGVHFNTVAEAYRQLAAEGWLNLKHGRGAVVVPRVAPAVTNGARNDDLRNRLRGLVAQLRAEGISVDSIADELRAMAKVVKRS
ncbi:MAG: GntR family transcriptional regulator [Bryobacteraceae bacterium]